uniref:Reverse transcriptase domain-containing protein n=1 Tax=Tanacetum cinerariifolium TaxID=118510 RepID=A0A6L2MNG3_TANCI|nr:reverse transcriptase domain-containing protein [Tanacetum cinerariifolium]
MRTRSSSNLIVKSLTIPKRRNRRRSKQIVEPELRTIIDTPVVTMADMRTMSELLQAPTEGYGDAIVIPAILAENFKLKVGLFSLVTSSQFHGFERDDPHSHIRWFNKITSTFKYKNVLHDAIKLMLFPFSLEGTKNLKNDITNFQQKFEETFSEACDRFKDLLRKFPHHGFLELHQIDTFYNSLTQSDQDLLNATADGNLLNCTPQDALAISVNNLKVRTSLNKPVVSKVNTTTYSSPSLKITALTDMVKKLVLMNKANQQAFVKAVEETCVTCGGPHPYYECLATDSNTFNAYAATGTYNQGGNQYRPQEDPNYRASNSSECAKQSKLQSVQSKSKELSSSEQSRKRSNKATLRAMQTQMTNMKMKLHNEFKSTIGTRTNKIENKNNQLMNMLTNMKKQNPSDSRTLPSNTVANPRVDIKAITTRSGVTYDGPTIPPTPSPLLKEVKRETKATKDKSLLSNKEKLFELASTPLNENCLAVLLKKLPEKLRDPGKFLIPCDFSELEECLALADLGASINLMPLSVWNKLSLSELTSTCMTLELANRSVVILTGVAEDVFVKVEKFYFLADFIVVDYDVDHRVPLILGRPFLRMARALINVHGEELTLRVNDEAVAFKVGHTLRYSRNSYDEMVHQVNVIDVACEENAQEVLRFSDSSTSGNPTPSDPIIASSSPSFTPFEGGDFILEEIEICLRTPNELSNLDDDDFDPEGDSALIEKLLNEDPSPNLPPLKKEYLKQVDVTMTKPSIEEPLELELKDLPSHLEYMFLEGTDKLPIIISKELKDEEKAALLKVLKSHKWTITWKISDIKGIEPRFYAHKILMKDDFKLAVQHQRRVNSKIHEVNKKKLSNSLMPD